MAEFDSLQVIQKALEDESKLPSITWEIEKSLEETKERLQYLATKCHPDIIEQHDKLIEINKIIKTSLKQAQSLNSRSVKLTQSICEPFEKMKIALEHYKIIQEAAMKVKLVNTFLLKVKKFDTLTGQSKQLALKEIMQIAAMTELRNIEIVHKTLERLVT